MIGYTTKYEKEFTMKTPNYSILLIIFFVPCMLFSQVKELATESAIVEIKSTQKDKEYDFYICIAYSDQLNTEPLKVEKMTTPFKLETKSLSIIAIITCEDYTNIKSSISIFDKTGETVGESSGHARRVILRRLRDSVDFSSI